MNTEEPGPGSGNMQKGKMHSPRKVAWSILIGLCLLSLGLCAMTAASYTEVVKAKTLTEVVTVQTPELTFHENGTLESLRMALEFNIVNPSGKELRVWVITYKGWVRDTPQDHGVDNSRGGVTGRILLNGTFQNYFPLFSAPYSFDIPAVNVPPGSSITITRHLELNRTSHPDIMEGFKSIAEYSAAMGLQLEWMHYTSAILFINGVPPQSGPNMDANLIRRSYGADITPGVGGAGP